MATKPTKRSRAPSPVGWPAASPAGAPARPPLCSPLQTRLTTFLAPAASSAAAGRSDAAAAAAAAALSEALAAAALAAESWKGRPGSAGTRPGKRRAVDSGERPATARLWVQAYAPTASADVEGNLKAREGLRLWLDADGAGGRPRRAGLLTVLYGAPGTGKTTIARVLPAELGFAVRVHNTSGYRVAADMTRILDSAALVSAPPPPSSKGPDWRPRSEAVVVLEEVDGASPEALAVLVRRLQEQGSSASSPSAPRSGPILCICNRLPEALHALLPGRRASAAAAPSLLKQLYFRPLEAAEMGRVLARVAALSARPPARFARLTTDCAGDARRLVHAMQDEAAAPAPVACTAVAQSADPPPRRGRHAPGRGALSTSSSSYSVSATPTASSSSSACETAETPRPGRVRGCAAALYVLYSDAARAWLRHAPQLQGENDAPRALLLARTVTDLAGAMRNERLQGLRGDSRAHRALAVRQTHALAAAVALSLQTHASGRGEPATDALVRLLVCWAPPAAEAAAAAVALGPFPGNGGRPSGLTSSPTGATDDGRGGVVLAQAAAPPLARRPVGHSHHDAWGEDVAVGAAADLAAGHGARPGDASGSRFTPSGTKQLLASVAVRRDFEARERLRMCAGDRVATFAFSPAVAYRAAAFAALVGA